MRANRLSWIKAFSTASVAALLSLSGCGSDDAETAGRPPAGAANAGGRCFFTVGRLGDGEVELFAAAGEGDGERIEQALAGGSDVDAHDMLKRTPLFAAAFCNRAAAASLLIEHGASVNASDFHGFAVLHAAVIAGSADAAKTLIAKGADINIRSVGGRTALHLAAATNQVAMIDLLMERGANAALRDHDGRTAVALAAQNGHDDIRAAVNKWLDKRRPAGKK